MTATLDRARHRATPALLRTAALTAAVVVAAAVAVVVAVVGRGGAELDNAKLVATLRAQLAHQGVQSDDLSCPDLPAQVGRSVRCSFTVGGQPVDAVATVSAVRGTSVTYAVHTEARPVARDLLARSVAQQLARTGTPAGAATCSGDLPAQVGATVTCRMAGTDVTNWTVRTTSVDGGRIDYSIEPARPT